MKSASIPTNFSWSAGWRVGVVVNDTVRLIACLERADAADEQQPPRERETLEAWRRIENEPLFQELKAASDAAWEALEAAEAAGDDERIVAAEASAESAAVQVVLGMSSGGQLHYLFSRAEQRRLGLTSRFGA